MAVAVTPSVAWTMFRNMPTLCGVRELCGAVMWAVENGWVTQTLGEQALEAGDPRAIEKIIARRAYLKLCRTRIDIGDRGIVREVMMSVPAPWLAFTSSLELSTQVTDK